MKPIKLVISAFGPFADVQIIDFNASFTSGLYLITGETGAGKTTVFDAISFALYGKASGEGRSDYNMLRSDFADDKAKTYVELDFVSGKSSYNIKRTIKKIGQDVIITLPDGTTMNGDRAVKQKVAEIIGLDREQFAQIVMIAQNDFLRFLNSGTDDRLKILRHIFGTGSLKQFQERLKALVKHENDKLMLILHDFKRYDVDIYKRGEQFAIWEAQIESDKCEQLEFDRQLAEYDRRKQALAADLAVAEELSLKFSELERNLRELDIHNLKSGEVSLAKGRASRGETALRKVKPYADELQKASMNYAAAEAEREKAIKAENTTNTALAAATEAIEALPLLDASQEAFNELVKEYESTADRLAKITALKNEYAVITAKKSDLSNNQSDFNRLNSEFVNADEKYRTYEEAFLRSQAGIIAQKLEEDKPCPVCGSPYHPAPAQLSRNAVTEAVLKKSAALRDTAQSKREACASKCSALRGEIETLTKRFIADLSLFIPNINENSIENGLGGLYKRTYTALHELSARKDADKKALDGLTVNWAVKTEQRKNAELSLKAARTLIIERDANARKLQKAYNTAMAAYSSALHDNAFIDEAEYLGALITDNELTEIKSLVLEYEKKGELLNRDIARLKEETANREQPDIEALRVKSKLAHAKSMEINEKRDKTNTRLNKTEAALKELRRAASDFEKVEKSYAAVKQLADSANGKLDFETYAQMAYFERVIRAANLRLRQMSQDRYTLLRKTDGGDRRRRTGLELEVLDNWTGKTRPANGLSGGESFMASLSLALGLSDIVQQSAGGIHLDAMFIDEGFGSLDTDVLEIAIRTLSDMSGPGRSIGIISHVTELRERIDRQIRIEKSPSGSRITVCAAL